MADEQAEVVVGPGSLPRELAPGGVGEIIGLRDAHLFLVRVLRLLLWPWMGRIEGGGLDEDGESHLWAGMTLLFKDELRQAEFE